MLRGSPFCQLVARLSAVPIILSTILVLTEEALKADFRNCATLSGTSAEQENMSTAA
jgi:hypothetical protein